jgi:trk system potassium uptake protein TrkA
MRCHGKEHTPAMRIVIMGCGRVGARLANTLHHEHEITIVDESPAAFERLSPDFSGRTVLGPGDDPEVLVQAGIRQADVYCALTNRDNANIMGSEMARELFHVPRVITRIYDHDREDIYHQLGLETICPTHESARVLEAMLTTEPGS